MTDDIEEMLKKKITISQFIKLNPKGAIIGIKDCDIPTLEEKLPSGHFTFNAEKLSIHKTSNKIKNDTRTDSERHSDEISIMDLLQVVENKQTELQAAIDERDYETILSLLQDFFSMIMIVNIEGSTVDFSGLRDRLQQTESQLGMKVYVMHEDIFRYMHRI